MVGVFRYQSTGATDGRHAIQDVSDADGVQLHRVTDVATDLQTQIHKETRDIL